MISIIHPCTSWTVIGKPDHGDAVCMRLANDRYDLFIRVSALLHFSTSEPWDSSYHWTDFPDTLHHWRWICRCVLPDTSYQF